MAETTTHQNLASIALVEAAGEWFVRVVEADGEVNTRSFDHKDHAVSFAEGQRARLGIEAFERL
ncbi:hypothetical protein [Mesorhizobium sp. B2-3-12]|uniref:hypothetical protein n=1 Tax=Mesorhizobium sp. B2-3-12 TaxID=2589952 RepID=UPI0011287744|nr:hypothetical protein [Mesorhizobium sp. B2-3-12]TPL88676.1 hypothetical protein FJ948_20895 [Mesorhizobium sp. B2-3-12]